MATVDATGGGLPAEGDPIEVDGLPGGPQRSLALAVEGDLVCLDRPRVGGRLIRASVGRELGIEYAVRRVPHTARLAVVAPPESTSTDGIWARLLAPPERHQRRREFRVEHVVPVIARRVDDEGEPTGEPITMTTADLSVGGLQVTTDEVLDVGTPLALVLALPDDDRPIGVLGHVRRVVPPDEEDASRPRLGLAFDEVEAADQERLRRVLLDLQRRQRRRELGLD